MRKLVRGKPSPERNPAARMECVLKLACGLFAKRGFEDTHIREVCRLAGVNISFISYYWHGKPGLYRAVQTRAKKLLSQPSVNRTAVQRTIPVEDHLCHIIESLLTRLAGESAWVAHLIARELADGTAAAEGSASGGLSADLALLESTIRRAVPELRCDLVQLTALGVLSQCVFISAAEGEVLSSRPRCGEDARWIEQQAHRLANLAIRGLVDGPTKRTHEDALG